MTEPVDGVDWKGAALSSTTRPGPGRTVLDPAECRALADLYDEDGGSFRPSTCRHASAKGSTGTSTTRCRRPSPGCGGILAHLLPIARHWPTGLARPDIWPDEFEDWLDQCHAPVSAADTAVLRYETGGGTR